jgi:hypothetical protein
MYERRSWAAGLKEAGKGCNISAGGRGRLKWRSSEALRRAHVVEKSFAHMLQIRALHRIWLRGGINVWVLLPDASLCEQCWPCTHKALPGEGAGEPWKV